MIEGLEAALNVQAAIVPMPEQPGDVPQTWASIDKARTLLGYAPKTTYSEGVREFIDWLSRTR
jgi:UDP-glucuronate 4-epimerase